MQMLSWRIFRNKHHASNHNAFITTALFKAFLTKHEILKWLTISFYLVYFVKQYRQILKDFCQTLVLLCEYFRNPARGSRDFLGFNFGYE